MQGSQWVLPYQNDVKATPCTNESANEGLASLATSNSCRSGLSSLEGMCQGSRTVSGPVAQRTRVALGPVDELGRITPSHDFIALSSSSLPSPAPVASRACARAVPPACPFDSNSCQPSRPAPTPRALRSSR